jgi:predicted lipoprotein with Yx(FWY)xxD motif
MKTTLPHRAKLAFPVILAIVVALALAACGEDESEAGDGPSTATESITVAEVDGRDVLADADGRTLYTAVQEKDGMIECTDSCLTIWDPVDASEGDSAADEVGDQLGEVERPDGGRQLTFGGAPLYRFQEEDPGELTGDNLVDEFDGTRFEWKAASPEPVSSEPEETAPSSEPSGGSGYSY